MLFLIFFSSCDVKEGEKCKERSVKNLLDFPLSLPNNVLQKLQVFLDNSEYDFKTKKKYIFRIIAILIHNNSRRLLLLPLKLQVQQFFKDSSITSNITTEIQDTDHYFIFDIIVFDFLSEQLFLINGVQKW